MVLPSAEAAVWTRAGREGVFAAANCAGEVDDHASHTSAPEEAGHRSQDPGEQQAEESAEEPELELAEEPKPEQAEELKLEQAGVPERRSVKFPQAAKRRQAVAQLGLQQPPLLRRGPALVPPRRRTTGYAPSPLDRLLVGFSEAEGVRREHGAVGRLGAGATTVVQLLSLEKDSWADEGLASAWPFDTCGTGTCVAPQTSEPRPRDFHNDHL